MAERTVLARAAFARIKQSATSDHDQIKNAGNILAQLPKDTLAPFLPDLIALSNDRDMRWPSLNLMTRFADFVDVGAERLLFLVSDSRHFGTDRDGNASQHPYLAGLIGLCKMGQGASTQGPDLLAMVKDGRVIVSDGPYGRLAMVTLIRLGVPQEEVREVAEMAKRPLDAERYDREIGRADNDRGCHF